MNFSKALQPYNTAAFADVEITPDLFTIKICESNAESQQYMARISEFAKFTNRKHVMFSGEEKARNQFYNDKQMGVLTSDVMEYLLNVIIVDWELKDDNGKKINFTEKRLADMFLSDDKAQRNATDRIARKLLTASTMTAFFEQIPLKN